MPIKKLFILLEEEKESFFDRGRYSGGTPDEGWMARELKAAWADISESFKEGLIDLLQEAGKGLINILTPIVEWGSKAALVVIILSIYCTDGEDKKMISKGILIFIVYVIFMSIRGAVL